MLAFMLIMREQVILVRDFVMHTPARPSVSFAREDLVSASVARRSLVSAALGSAAVLLAMASASAQAPPITFVQSNYAVPQTPQTTVTVRYTAVQTAGDLNVVAVGWNDATSHVLTVNDTSGNVYSRAIATVQPGVQSQSIYYAANIAAAGVNTNVVTLTFDAAADYPDVRITEYSGISMVNPVDVAVGASGIGATASSGAVSTTNANDLLVGADNVQTGTPGPGTGYTQRMITSPDGNILEDQVVTALGSYSATAPLSGSGGWVMQMVAFKAISGSPDTQPPTVPTNLAATAASSSQINLAWTASTDNVGVTEYLVEQCQGISCTTFAQIGASTTPGYSSTGLTPSTSYSYRVRASDAAGNLSGYSTTASATTAGSGPPPITFVQSNYAVPQTPQTTVTVRYTAAQTAGNLNVVAVGWNDATSHVLTVNDTSGNLYSRAVATVQPGLQSHSIYYAANIAAAAVNTNVVTLTFDAAADYPDVRIAEYGGIAPVNPVDVAVGASGIGATASSGAVSTTNMNDLLVGANNVQTSTTGPGTGYTQRVITSPDGNMLEDQVVTALGSYGATAPLSGGSGWVMQMVAFKAVSGAPDTQPPSVPTNLTATAISISQINLAWTASTDNVGVTGYRVEQCLGTSCTTFAQIGTSTAPSYSNTGLNPSTGYSYRVRATDAAGNLSGYSNTATATTTSIDTQPPTVPVNLTATAISSSQINLAWTASTDNVGVTGYRVEQCLGTTCTTFAEIGISTTPSYSNTGLTPSTGYSYRVRATDAAGNLSGYSNTATATTSASAPPHITFVQSNYAVPQTRQTTVTVLYTAAQTTGNLNVVAVGWNDVTSHVLTVNDTSGNVYARAVGPTLQPGIQSASIYYAPNIAAAGAARNTVTVTFDAAADFADVKIAEYGGIDPVNPVDVAVGASGTGATASSGTVATTNANDLLVGANNVQMGTTGPGAGYTERVLTTPDGNILEDRIVTAAGSYSATAPVISGGWVMQMVAFRANGGSLDTQPPTVPTNLTATAISNSQINLAWTASTDNVAVTGYRVERCTGAGCTTFAQVGAPATPGYSDAAVVGSTTYSYRVRATDGPNFSGYSSVATATTLPNPVLTITISTPGSGAALSGTVTLGATVSGAGIGGVQFQVDGVNVGPATPAPYTYSFDTTQLANGSHSLGAYTWDNLRTIGTAAPVAVTFSNSTPGNPAQNGLWSGLFTWPLVSVHINLMPDGRVLMWDRMNSGNPDPQVWDPVTSTFTTVPVNDSTNLFCAGSLTLPDGRVLAAGGHVADNVGTHTGRIFDPKTMLWTSTPDMSYGRWYPTVTILPDGRILTLAGEDCGLGCNVNIPEIYDPVANTWATLPSASLNLPYYPHVFVLPNGKILVTGTAEAAVPARVLNLATQTWTTVDATLDDAYSSAMYIAGKVLKTGTSTDSNSTKPSSAKAYVLDMNVPTPAWRQIASMAFPRAYHVETLLPDGNVLITGGGKTTGDYDIPNAVYNAELWSPTTEAFTTLGAMNAPRLYHQTAFLLPDARVLVSGGGRSPGPSPLDQESGEIFAPPYLFKGPRPTITSAPTQLMYNGAFTVQTPDAARIAKVVLMGISDQTHGFNMNQRNLPLSFTAGTGSVTASAPVNSNLAPPGWYMLFLVDTNGVPSVSEMVHF
jgi:hypothetical protein